MLYIDGQNFVFYNKIHIFHPLKLYFMEKEITPEQFKIFKKFKEIVVSQKYTDLDENEIKLESKIYDDLCIDSIDFFDTIRILEEYYCVEIDYEIEKKLRNNTVKDIVFQFELEGAEFK